MIRELKFRSWDGRYFSYLDLRTDDDMEFRHFYSNIDIDSPIEQYTGLKDENGKEIYEGDIVRHGKTILEIKFDEIKDSDFTYYYLGWIMECDTYTDSLCEYNNAVEVIGNIHENPGLLGGKNEKTQRK